jgi:hypothetical protein
MANEDLLAMLINSLVLMSCNCRGLQRIAILNVRETAGIFRVRYLGCRIDSGRV